MKLCARMTAGLLAALLAGCGGSDVASYMVDGRDTALTLERIKAFAWSDEWELDMVVRRAPECQRRHKLQPSANASPKIQLYTPASGIFIIQEDRHWYVTDMKSCNLQAFKNPPPEPGVPVGAFVEKDGGLAFVKNP